MFCALTKNLDDYGSQHLIQEEKNSCRKASIKRLFRLFSCQPVKNYTEGGGPRFQGLQQKGCADNSD
jgi:hypothetical protein